MTANETLKLLQNTASEIQITGGTDEQWSTVFRCIGSLGETLRQLSRLTGPMMEDVELERLSRVRPRGGA